MKTNCQLYGRTAVVHSTVPNIEKCSPSSTSVRTTTRYCYKYESSQVTGQNTVISTTLYTWQYGTQTMTAKMRIGIYQSPRPLLTSPCLFVRSPLKKGNSNKNACSRFIFSSLTHLKGCLSNVAFQHTPKASKHTERLYKAFPWIETMWQRIVYLQIPNI